MCSLFPHPRPSSRVPYVLPSSVYAKSFVSHSYENYRGVPSFFPFWNPASDKDASPEGPQRAEGSLRDLSHSSLATRHFLAAPKEVGGEADSKQNDGCGEVLELCWVAKCQAHGIPDNSGGREDKKNRRPGISRHAVRNRPAPIGAPNRKNRCGPQAIENPADEDHAFNQLLERAQFSSADEYCRPY